MPPLVYVLADGRIDRDAKHNRQYQPRGRHAAEGEQHTPSISPRARRRGLVLIQSRGVHPPDGVADRTTATIGPEADSGTRL